MEMEGAFYEKSIRNDGGEVSNSALFNLLVIII